MSDFFGFLSQRQELAEYIRPQFVNYFLDFVDNNPHLRRYFYSTPLHEGIRDYAADNIDFGSAITEFTNLYNGPYIDARLRDAGWVRAHFLASVRFQDEITGRISGEHFLNKNL